MHHPSLSSLFRYKCQADFANDARLVFNNCETFNEDDSDVGIAGHTMRKSFEMKWAELLLTGKKEEERGREQAPVLQTEPELVPEEDKYEDLL
jgi:hypothetical protein